MELLKRIRDKALGLVSSAQQGFAQIASNPTLNNVANNIQAGRERVAQSNPSDYLLNPLNPRIRQATAPLTVPIGNAIQSIPNVPTFKAPTLPNPLLNSLAQAQQDKLNLGNQIMNNIGLPVVRDYGNTLVEYGQNKALDFWDALNAMDIATPGIPETAIAKAGSVPFIGALAKSQGDTVIKETTDTGLKTIKASFDNFKPKEFVERVGKKFFQNKADDVTGQKLHIADAAMAVKSKAYPEASLLSDMHEWFSRGSNSFESEKFVKPMAYYIDTLGEKRVRKVFNKHANATNIAPDSKTKIWEELGNMAPKKWEDFEKERIESLVKGEVPIQPKGVVEEKLGFKIPKTILESETEEIKNIIKSDKELTNLASEYHKFNQMERYAPEGKGVTKEAVKASELYREIMKRVENVNPALSKGFRKDTLAKALEETKAITNLPTQVSKGVEIPEVAPKVKTQDVITKSKVQFLGDKFTPENVAKEKSSIVQAYSKGLNDKVTESLNQKGVTWEQLVDQIESGNIDNLVREEADAVSKFFTTLNEAGDIKLSRKAPIRQNYFPRRTEEQLKEVIETGFGETLVDASYLKRRTGSLKDYVKSGDVLQRYAAEVLGADDVVKNNEIKVANEIVNEIKETMAGQNIVKNVVEPKIDFVGKMSKLDPDGEKVTYLADRDTNKLFDMALRGIDERASRAGGNIYDNFIDPFKQAQIKIATSFDNLTKLADDALKGEYVKNFGRLKPEISREQMIARLSQFNYKRAWSEATNIFMKNVKNGDFPQTHVKQLINEIANEYITKDVVQQNSLKKIMGFIRGMTGRGALGLNVASGINNILELKRALSTVSTKATKNAIQRLASGENITAKYGIISKVSTALERGTINDFRNKVGKAIQKVDDGLFYMFDKSELLKDNYMLLSFEEQGLEKKLAGEELRKYVQRKFSQYAVKYGKGQDIGIYRNDFVRTLGQFGQYAVKDLVIAMDKVAEAAPKSIGGLGDTGSRKYLAKYAVTSVLQMAAFYAVLGQTGFGGQTNTPFDFLKSLTEGKAGRSPIVSLVLNLIGQATADDEESDYDKQKRNKDLTKNIGIMTVPAYNQLVSKTGAYAKDLKRGYSETYSGNVANETSKDIPSKIKGLLFGPSYDPKRQEYINEGVKTGNFPTLNEKESTIYKGIDNPEERTKYYETKKGQPLTQEKLIEKTTKKETKGFLDFFKKDEPKVDETSAIKELHFKDGDATSTDWKVKKNAFKEIDKVMNDSEVPQEYKDKVIEASGASKEDIEYFRLASMDSLDKREGLVEFANGKFASRDEFISALASNKRTVGGKAVSGTGDFDYLYDQGIISKDEKSFLNAIKYDETKGTFYMDRDYKLPGTISDAKRRSMIKRLNSIFKLKSSSKKPKASKVKIPKIPTIQLPKLTSGSTRTKDRWFNTY